MGCLKLYKTAFRRNSWLSLSITKTEKKTVSDNKCQRLIFEREGLENQHEFLQLSYEITHAHRRLQTYSGTQSVRRLYLHTCSFMSNRPHYSTTHDRFIMLDSFWIEGYIQMGDRRKRNIQQVDAWNVLPCIWERYWQEEILEVSNLMNMNNANQNQIWLQQLVII